MAKGIVLPVGRESFDFLSPVIKFRFAHPAPQFSTWKGGDANASMIWDSEKA